MTGDLAAIRDWLERLVAHPTVSRDSNLSLIEEVRDHLSAHGIDSRLTFDDERRKANLYATLGPTDRPGILLSGHTDVVPVDGQDWDTDPFRVVERDGRLYGRGTADMKGFLATVLAFVPEFLRRGPATPVHLAFSYDEEVGCVGVRRLIADLERMPVRPALCIVGEPTGMQVMRGHKGKLSMTCRVRGRSCHSALTDRGVNAVEIAAELIARLRRMAREARENGPRDDGFEPPYTTIHTGVVRGGTALNVVPDDCRFEFEFRHLPADDPERLFEALRAHAEERLLPEMRAVAPEAGFEWQPLSRFPGLDTPEDAEVTRLAKALSGSNATGKVAFGTEGGLFHGAGIPSVVCGPGDIADAHKANESVSLEQLGRCRDFMARLAERVAA